VHRLRQISVWLSQRSNEDGLCVKILSNDLFTNRAAAASATKPPLENLPRPLFLLTPLPLPQAHPQLLPTACWCGAFLSSSGSCCIFHAFISRCHVHVLRIHIHIHILISSLGPWTTHISMFVTRFFRLRFHFDPSSLKDPPLSTRFPPL